jgi:hypothetical protein
MKRLPISGTSIATPFRSEGELKRALSDVGAADAFDEAGVREIYAEIGMIIGAWVQEHQSMEASPVAKALLSTARNLDEASRLLSGYETGMRTRVEIEVTSQTARFLALDPTVRTLKKAQELISSFQKEAARIAHACMIAYVDLAGESDHEGRPALRWYDDFTALLLKIATAAGIDPRLGKSRDNGTRSGWLFEAALAFEGFLDPYMRSPSAEACGKRLERSRRRLRQSQRQNTARI